jgi:hypothetical protein
MNITSAVLDLVRAERERETNEALYTLATGLDKAEYIHVQPSSVALDQPNFISPG